MELPTFISPNDRKINLFFDDEQVKNQVAQWFEEDFEKLDTLCKIYKVYDGPDKYKYLALELARDLFPEPKKKGRVRKWRETVLGCLYVEVKRIVEIDKEENDVEAACLRLANEKIWNDFMQDGIKERSTLEIGESLRKRYYEARKNAESNDCFWYVISFNAFSYHEIKNDRQGWFKHIEFILDYAQKSKVKRV